MTSANAAVTTLAGSGVGAADGFSSKASFSAPTGITTDGVNLYIADSRNRTIRKIAPNGVGATLNNISNGSTMLVSTLAGSAVAAASAIDGTGTMATFGSPSGIATDGNHLFVSDSGGNNVRMITPAGGTALSTMSSASTIVSTLAGTVTAGVLSH